MILELAGRGKEAGGVEDSVEDADGGCCDAMRAVLDIFVEASSEMLLEDGTVDAWGGEMKGVIIFEFNLRGGNPGELFLICEFTVIYGRRAVLTIFGRADS